MLGMENTYLNCLLKDNIYSRLTFIQPTFVSRRIPCFPKTCHRGLQVTPLAIASNSKVYSPFDKHIQPKKIINGSSASTVKTCAKSDVKTRKKSPFRLGQREDLDCLYQLATHDNLLPPNHEDLQTWIDRREIFVVDRTVKTKSTSGMLRFYHAASIYEREKLFKQFGLISESTSLLKIPEITCKSNRAVVDLSFLDSHKAFETFLESLHIFYAGSLIIEQSCSSLTTLYNLVFFSLSHYTETLKKILKERKSMLNRGGISNGTPRRFGLLFGTSINDQLVTRISQLLWAKWIRSSTGREGKQYTLTFLHNRPDGIVSRGSLVVFEI